MFSSVMAIKTYGERQAEQMAFDQLASKVTPLPDEYENELTKKSKYTEYISLDQQNKDFVCWISIDGTSINYPVMYTPHDPEFYLRRAFDKSDSQSGTPFIGAGGTVDSDSFIIYGHNMKNGSMFGNLDYYKDVDFYKVVPTFNLTTLTERRTYEVFSAMKTYVPYEDGKSYYDYVGDLSEKEFTELMDWIRNHSLYDTKAIPKFGEQIVMLSTCSYHREDGRFVVAARRID